MMKQEFEALAGYEVSYDDYVKIIEPMYLATELSKQDFVKTLNKKAFALKTKKQLVAEMRKLAKHLAETCEQYTDHDAQEELERDAKEYARRFFGCDFNDLKDWYYFKVKYTYQEIFRGCTFPAELVIGRNDREVERLVLVK